MRTQPLLDKRLVLSSEPLQIREVEAVIEEISNQLDFKEDVYGNIMVAVTEAVNNSIHHGNANDPSKKVFIDFEMESTYRLLVRVADEGKGFNPDSLSDPTAPANLENIGGRGVFLMNHLADELSFLDEGRKVEMIFNI